MQYSHKKSVVISDGVFPDDLPPVKRGGIEKRTPHLNVMNQPLLLD